MTEIDSPNTTSTDIGYNNANQPTVVSYWSSGTKQDQWNFGYDGVGNLTSMQDQSATSPTTYGYDANNNLTNVTEPVSGGSDTESLTLDPNGNPTKVAYQLGSSTGPTWSIYNALDIAGNLRSVNDNNQQTMGFEYDDHGNVVKSTDSQTGQAEFFSYNPDQQVSRVTFKGNSTTGNTNDFSYQYDADGRITKITNNANGASVSYTYNSIGELTQETTWDGRTISYTYDNVGNRTSMSVTQNGTITTTNYGYDNEKNRLTSITVGSNPAQSVTYDGMGNTLSDGTNTYTWNAANELASVTVPGGTVYNYTYDGLGRRVTAYGDTYHYNGQSTQIAYITDANNKLVAWFSCGANGPAYMTLASGKVYRYVYDGQGDVIGLVDVTSGSSTLGQEVVTYSYDAWGNIVSKTDTSGANAGTINPFTYHGYVYDSQTGLYYLNARYYNPVTGRFLSEDPVSPNANDSLSFNEYAYAGNNPTMNIDPNGDNWFTAVWYKIESWFGFRSSTSKIAETKKFPKNPDDFKPNGLVRRDYKNGEIIKWHDPNTRKAQYEWNKDDKYGDHYHATPDGKTRMPNPETKDTHYQSGATIPDLQGGGDPVDIPEDIPEIPWLP